MTVALHRLLERLPGAKPSGNGWVAPCPAHDDRNPSLSIGAGDDGRVLLRCHAGCSTEAILATLGLTMAELSDQTQGPLPQIVATYDYRDEAGTLIFQAVRFSPKAFRQRRPDGEEWIWNLEGVPRVLYRLPDLISAPPDAFIYVVEGEKDADRLRSAGMFATTCPMGAGTWSKVDDSVLCDHHVVILPDADAEGRMHAEDVRRGLHGRAKSVRVLDLGSDRDDGSDVSDWLDAGHDPEDLDRLANETNPCRQTPDSFPAPMEVERARNEFPLPVPASQLAKDGEQVEWTWRGFLATGFITLFTGLWKAGKTTLLAHLVRALESDGDFMGVVAQAQVLVIAEEGQGLWARRRDTLSIGDHAAFICRPFLRKPQRADWEGFIRHVAAQVRERSYRVVILDTLGSVAPFRDENDAAAMTEALMPLHEITQAGAAVLLVHHPRKGDAGEGQASRGSGALPGFVDIIVELRRYDPNKRGDARRVLTTYSRFDESPPETVIELRDDGYHAVGTKAEASRGDRLNVISEILATAAEALPPTGVRDGWPEDHPKPGERTIRADLEIGYEVGKWGRRGAGKKGNPYKYLVSCKHTLLSAGNESQDDLGDSEDTKSKGDGHE